MPGTRELQYRLANDPAARRAFAADPRGVIAALGIELPEGVELPDHIDEGALERALEAQTRFESALDRVGTREPGAVGTTVVGPDLPSLGVLVAFCLVVTSVGAEDVVRPAQSGTSRGVEGVSRRARGLTVHGPKGLTIEGASVDDVAELLMRLRRFP